MNDLRIKEWLETRSTSWQRIGNELIFNHKTGDTSILLLRSNMQAALHRPACPCLREFYESYEGASIGDGDIMIGTLGDGIFPVSHGYNLPTLEEIASQAREFGMPLPPKGGVFAMSSSWMFLYLVEQLPTGETLLRYDRDFHKIKILSGFEQVLEEWWAMVQEI